ncbi:MAG: hypothetical protein ACJ0BB_03100 [Dehalococcoidia bacterium]
MLSSRKLTSWALISGPIITLIGFIGITGIAATFPESPSNEAAFIAKLGANADVFEIGAAIGLLGWLIIVVAFGGLSYEMTGGKGYPLARAGTIVAIVGLAITTIEYPLLVLVGDSVANGNMALANTVYPISNAIGGWGISVLFLGIAVIGGGIFVQSTINKIVAGLVIANGLFGSIIAISMYENDIMGIPFILGLILTIILGFLFLRSED